MLSPLLAPYVPVAAAERVRALNTVVLPADAYPTIAVIIEVMGTELRTKNRGAMRWTLLRANDRYGALPIGQLRTTTCEGAGTTVARRRDEWTGLD